MNLSGISKRSLIEELKRRPRVETIDRQTEIVLKVRKQLVEGYKCGHCGHEYDEEANYCSKCGRRQAPGKNVFFAVSDTTSTAKGKETEDRDTDKILFTLDSIRAHIKQPYLGITKPLVNEYIAETMPDYVESLTKTFLSGLDQAITFFEED